MIALQTLRRLFLGSTVLLLQLPNLAQAETPIAAQPGGVGQRNHQQWGYRL